MTTVALTDEAVTPAGDIAPDYEVVIIGAGFGGIGAGVELQRKGISDFIMIEKWDAVGGTWHANKYRGVAVEHSHLHLASPTNRRRRGRACSLPAPSWRSTPTRWWTSTTCASGCV